MYNYKLLIFIIMIIIIIPFAWGCSGSIAESYSKAEAGVIDLTQMQYEDEIAALNGQWEFYWNRLLSPDEIESSIATGYIHVPGSWNKYILNENSYAGDGYATYRLKFITKDADRLALKIPRLRTAYKLWVNGEMIASAGIVGTARDTMVPQYLPQVSFFEAQRGENEILIQVSNFHHRIGGILESIDIGSENQIFGLKFKRIAVEFIIFGSLIFIGIYHLALFFFRRKKDRFSWYFGLFCILIGIRVMFVGECLFTYLFPEFSWEIGHKILTLTYIIGAYLILMFFASSFPKYFNGLIIGSSQIIAVVFALLILITCARIFTYVSVIYQIWSIGIIMYILWRLTVIFINKEKDVWIIGLGALVLLLCSANDIIFFSPLMDDNQFNFLKLFIRTGNLTSLGQFVFACTNSLSIAKRFSDSMEQEEIMTAKLTEINAHLDELVLQRTKELAESNQKIELQNLELEKRNRALSKLSFKDPLTGVWNRRKYDQVIKLEWNRCLRYQRPMAILFLDMDYFKDFNDFYGHTEGDECLVQIGKTLDKSLSRSTEMVARYGGEEFVVLLTEAGKEDAIKTAHMLREKIENLNIPHEKSIVSNYVTVSIGVAFTIPDFNSSYQELFSLADKALYEAKDAGRNQVKFLSR